jgi:xanthine dehydrogenase iron-sulfur cluster and FAD-binding subunit A
MEAATPESTTIPPERRTFTWGISSSEIPFMRATEAETAGEGSNCGNGDCGAITRLPSRREQGRGKTERV